MEDKAKDLHLRCRICLLINTDVVSLFDSNNGESSIADMLLNVAGLKIKDEEMLPNLVCSPCNQTITEFYNLLRCYRDNEDYLEKMLKDIKIEEFEETLDGTAVSEEYLSDQSDRKVSENILYVSGVNYENISKNNPVNDQTNDIPDSILKVSKRTNSTKQTNSMKQSLPKPKTFQKKGRHQCQICRKSFEDLATLKEHYIVHKTHKCKTCGAAFMKKSYLRDHQMMHSSEKRYLCKDCGKGFKYRNGLAVHRTVHDNYRGIICELCGAGFNAKTTLKTHIKLKHIGDKTFPCSECDQSFKVKSWLDKHYLRKHTGDRQKDFVCSMCGIAYLNKTTLTRHIADKHTGTPVRHFCKICDKSYTMKNKLNKHVQNEHHIILTL